MQLRTKKEPETERGTGTAGTVFQEPEPEPELSLSVKLYWNTENILLSPKEPPEPKTGTARSIPPPNHNWTEPGPPWD